MLTALIHVGDFQRLSAINMLGDTFGMLHYVLDSEDSFRGNQLLKRVSCRILLIQFICGLIFGFGNNFVMSV